MKVPAASPRLSDKEETISYLMPSTRLISLTLGLASQDDGTTKSGVSCTWMHFSLGLRQGEDATVPVIWPELWTSSDICGLNCICLKKKKAESQAIGLSLCLTLMLQALSRSMLTERLPMRNFALETMLLCRGLGKAFLL